MVTPERCGQAAPPARQAPHSKMRLRGNLNITHGATPGVRSLELFIKRARVITLFLFLTAAFELVLGGVLSLRTTKFIKTAHKTSGRIVKLEKRESFSDEKPSVTYYPIYVFTDDSGVEHRITSNTGSYPPAFKVGEAITVLYRPGNPKAAEIDSFWTLWLLPCVLGGIASFEIIAGLLILSLAPVIARLGLGRPTVAPTPQA